MVEKLKESVVSKELWTKLNVKITWPHPRFKMSNALNDNLSTHPFINKLVKQTDTIKEKRTKANKTYYWKQQIKKNISRLLIRICLGWLTGNLLVTQTKTLWENFSKYFRLPLITKLMRWPLLSLHKTKKSYHFAHFSAFTHVSELLESKLDKWDNCLSNLSDYFK